MNTKTAATIWGVLFIGVGILGFISNPIIYDSQTAIFHADKVHNMVHIVSGVLFLLIALTLPDSASTFLIAFGIVYFFLGIMGLVNYGTEGMGQLLGFLHVNGADNFLHIGLGTAIFLSGIFFQRHRRAATG